MTPVIAGSTCPPSASPQARRAGKSNPYRSAPKVRYVLYTVYKVKVIYLKHFLMSRFIEFVVFTYNPDPDLAYRLNRMIRKHSPPYRFNRLIHARRARAGFRPARPALRDEAGGRFISLRLI